MLKIGVGFLKLQQTLNAIFYEKAGEIVSFLVFHVFSVSQTT